MRLLLLAVLVLPPILEAQQDHIQAGRQLEYEGKQADAVRAYLQQPNAEYLAAGIARRKPAEFAPVLDALIASAPGNIRTRAILVRGDVYLASGDKSGALNAYRQVSMAYAARPDYPLEPQGGPVGDGFFALPDFNGARDNWLLRRYITLQASSDADAEFARIWKVHRTREAKSPYFVSALQFAVDYAFYLRERNQIATALAVLKQQTLRLDLDRVAGFRDSQHRVASVPTGGITPATFLSATYGFFAAANREQELFEAAVNDSRPSAKRIVAWILLRQGKPEAALSKELEYIETGAWSAASKAMRRAAIFQESGKAAQAAAEYESALSLGLQNLDLPDAEYLKAGDLPVDRRRPLSTPNPDTIRGRILERLVRLYSGLGQAEMELSAWERLLQDDAHLSNLDWLERAQNRFSVSNLQSRFQSLLTIVEAKQLSAEAKANASWLLNDLERAAGHIAGLAISEYELQSWKNRFQSKGMPAVRLLLETRLKQNPAEVNTRLELIALDWPNVTVSQLEPFLSASMPKAYGAGKSSRNRTPFQTISDITYRLARTYERNGEYGKLSQLGLRIVQEGLYVRPDDANHTLSVVLERANGEQRTLLAKNLADQKWAVMRRQLERQSTMIQDKPGRRFGWSPAVPSNVRMLASNETVTDLYNDARYVYSGHAWGIAIYTHAGEPVTRVPLGMPVTSLSSSGTALWVGTQTGLFRVALSDFRVSKVGSPNLAGGIEELAVRGDRLWIGGAAFGYLDLRTNALHLYAPEDAGTRLHGRIRHFLFDGPYMWLQADGTISRLDTRNEAFETIHDSETTAGMELLTLYRGTVWARRNLPVMPGQIMPYAFRPVASTLRESSILRIDTQSLQIRRVPAVTTAPFADVRVSRAVFREGRLVLDQWIYDPAADTLEQNHTSGEQNWEPDEQASSWTPRRRLRLPDGTIVTAPVRSSTFVGEPEGVLFQLPGGGRIEPSRELAGVPYSDVLGGNRCTQATTTTAGIWIGTEAGLVFADKDLRIQRSYTRNDGLPHNEVTSVVQYGDDVFLSCPGTDFSLGGLVRLGGKSAVFTYWDASDGLPQAKVDRIRAASPNELAIDFAATRDLASGRFVQYPPMRFSIREQRFSGLGQPVPATPDDQSKTKSAAEMPWLGGAILQESALGSLRLLIGERGVVAVPAGVVPASIEAFPISESGSLMERIAADQILRSSQLPPSTAAHHPNRYVRLQILESAVLNPPLRSTALLGANLHDEFPPIRALALQIAAQLALTSAEVDFRKGLLSTDMHIRQASAYGLAMLGKPAEESHYEPMIRARADNRMDALPVEAPLSVSPSSKIVSLLLRYEIADTAALAKAVPQNSSLLETLLRSENNGRFHAPGVSFAQLVLGTAGPRIRERLHQALQSEDETQRSNAARALGFMGDLSAIPMLTNALSVEGSVAQASAVWALGHLHAVNAVPALADLYVRILPRSSSIRGTPYLAQMGSGIAWRLESVDSVEALRRTWAQPEQNSQQHSLTPEIILSAIAEIGPALAGQFYRTLAASDHAEARHEAAVRLVGADRENVGILQGLLGDPDASVAAAAAVTLYQGGAEEGKRYMEIVMKSCSAHSLLYETRRISDTRKLEFLRPALTACEAQRPGWFESDSYDVGRILGRRQ